MDTKEMESADISPVSAPWKETETPTSNRKHGDLYTLPNVPELPVYIPMVGMNCCDATYFNVREKAEHSVIGYVINGQGEIKVGAEAHRLARGDAFLLRQDSRHEVRALSGSEEPWTYYWINVHGNSLPLLDSFSLLHTSYIPGSEAEPLFRQSMDAASLWSREARSGIQTTLLLLCAEILMTLRLSAKQRDDRLPPIMNRMKAYLDPLIGEPFRSERFAARMGMSFRQLNRIFNQYAGITIYQYVLARKLEMAKLLLRDTGMPVGEVAARVGYDDPQYFSNLFKQKTGLSPTAYRRLIGQ